MCPLLIVQIKQADLNIAALYGCNENLVPRDKCIFNFSIYFSSLDSVNGVSFSHPWLVFLVSEISLEIFSMTLRLAFCGNKSSYHLRNISSLCGHREDRNLEEISLLSLLHRGNSLPHPPHHKTL